VKTADASTWDVVMQLKAKLPEMKSLLPDDVQINYEFDQSVFVINAVKGLLTEAILGAILTGLMVLLFLRDWRSSLVVIITIPIAILSSVLFLNLTGQTINIMTLSGLALAIGVLVDQSTVTIENIPSTSKGKSKGRPSRCLFRNFISTAADPAVYTGCICSFLCDGGAQGHVSSPFPFHWVCHDLFTLAAGPGFQ
jgi:multidrug efflux pump subunit AcrB